MVRKIIILTIGIIFFVSCGDEDVQQIDGNFVSSDTFTEQNKVYIQYSIPLPLNLFLFIGENGTFKPEIMSTLTSAKKNYHTQVQSALKLGLFTADLAYCTMFDNGQCAVEYSNTASFFANELSIKDAYGKPFIKRLEQNIENKDSLIIISNQAYNGL